MSFRKHAIALLACLFGALSDGHQVMNIVCRKGNCITPFCVLADRNSAVKKRG